MLEDRKNPQRQTMSEFRAGVKFPSALKGIRKTHGAGEQPPPYETNPMPGKVRKDNESCLVSINRPSLNEIMEKSSFSISE